MNGRIASVKHVHRHHRSVIRTLHFSAAGGNLLCGRANRYQFVTSSRPVTAQSFKHARHLGLKLRPAKARVKQSIKLPRGLSRYIAVRAVDAAGNIGLPLVLKLPR